MKKTILALAAAGLATLASAQQAPAPAPAPETAAPTRLEPKTTFGDVARVLSAQPVYEKTPYARRECRLENTGYTAASPAAEVQRCDEIADARERIVAYDVTYQDHGREFRIRRPHDPGEQMGVNVDVRPPMAEPRRGAPATRYRGPY